ncbi:hypothetical protein JCM5350_006899 [Sporobolomyces pararoseus]
MVTLIALILIGTVIVLTTVVQYFGVDSRDIITELEMNMYERLASTAQREAELSREKQQKIVTAPLEPERVEIGGSGEGLPVVSYEEDKEQSLNEFMNGLEERGWLDSSSDGQEQAGAGGLSLTAKNSSTVDRKPRIPKIIHATWKTDVLPDRWEKIRQGCIDLHPDYEFMLWSDASSRNFIAEYYPWFLSTFDGYVYPIQRADVIRYFVLHRFGGIYMDLDIGCRRNMDPLLYFEVILPQTIPVGVSNDLMFAEKNHPFMDLVIHNLITFDHTYGTNYPTVMFSTGPMFLSAQYGLWPKDVSEGMERQVRVLPRRWYGKNAPPSQMTDSYFDHYYGSSWHAEDAGFITFLGKFGIALMYAGLALVVLGLVRLLWSKRSFLRSSPRILGPISLPHGTPNSSDNEALPYIRPDTPGGSRPSTPFDGSPNGSTNGRPQANRPGLLYYLPVWVMPPGDRSHGGATSPNPADANWSQYFSNLSFVDSRDQANRYHPIPSFSRPPSPSNNSILHAPGSTHDGAFDGVQLHSIQAPQPTRSSATTTGPSSSSSSTLMPTSSTGPNSPPAYSTLRSVGANLFRPIHSIPSKESRESFHSEHSPSSFERFEQQQQQQEGTFESKLFTGSSTTSGSNRHSSTGGNYLRPRSPNPNSLPPQYSSSPEHLEGRPRSNNVNFGSSSRSSSPSPQGSSATRFASSTEHGTEFGRSAETQQSKEEGDDESFDFEYENSDNNNYDGSGVPLEEEVDRLLNEMSPSATTPDLEKGQR